MTKKNLSSSFSNAGARHCLNQIRNVNIDLSFKKLKSGTFFLFYLSVKTTSF